MSSSAFFSRKKIVFHAKILLVVLLVIGLAATLLSWRAQQKLAEQLALISGLSYKTAAVHLLSRKIELSGVHYIDSLQAPEAEALQCASLVLRGIHWRSLWQKEELIVNQLTVRGVKGAWYPSEAKEAEDNKRRTFWIKKLRVEDASMAYYSPDGGELRVWELEADLRDLRSVEEAGVSTVEYGDFTVQTAELSWLPAEGWYSYHSGAASLDAGNRVLLVKELMVKPRYKKGESAEFDLKRTILQATLPGVSATGVDFDALLRDGGLKMDLLTLQEAQLQVTVRKNCTKVVTTEYAPFLQEKLIKSPLAIDVPKVEVKKGAIRIIVTEPQLEEATDLSFEQIYASLYHISNVPERISAHPEITADVKSLFAGEGDLNVKFRFALNDPLFGYAYDASLDYLDLPIINNIIDSDVPVRVKSGVLHQLKFTCQGNRDLATGSLDGDYENLRVEVVGKKPGESKKVISALLNNLALKNDNEQGTRNYRSGKIYYPRAREKGLFHQWWHAIQSGLKSTVLPNVFLPKELRN